MRMHGGVARGRFLLLALAPPLCSLDLRLAACSLAAGSWQLAACDLQLAAAAGSRPQTAEASEAEAALCTRSEINSKHIAVSPCRARGGITRS
jgi:hypothetical protein